MILYGKVKKIKFHNPEDKFYILDAEINNKVITVLGHGDGFLCNDHISIDGEYQLKTYKKKTKEQLKAKYIKKIHPNTSETILEYLSSGIIKGIGKKTAINIVKMWGEDSLDIIDKKPNLLKRINGIGTQKLIKIMNSWEEVKPKDQEITKLLEMGFNSAEAIKIFKTFKDKSIDIIQSNPYFVYQKIKFLNFQKIDAIAIQNGTPPNDPNRILSGIEYILINQHKSTGDTIIELSTLKSLATKTLNINNETITEIVDKAIKQNLIYIHQKENQIFVQHNSIYDAEIEIAQKIFYLYKNEYFHNKHKPISKLYNIKREGEKQISFSNEQKDAIIRSVNSKISVLTGKPGTGKTTVLNEIVKQLKHQGKNKILLCAPTGKAAQKMKESTGMEAYTIHRLLDYNPIKDRFNKNINNPLNTDVLIIDEASMIDIFLMANLIRAIHNNTQLIITGDVNQLPSINCGSVLRDIIESKKIPTSFLNEIKRTNGGNQSEIINVAHDICDHGNFNVHSHKEKESDLYFIETNSDEKTLHIVKKIINEKIEETFKKDKFKDLQILSPIHGGVIGTKNLNKVCQDIINNNDNQDSINYLGFNYKVGDKIIQVQNNYDKDVFNGDSGIIQSIDADYINILFDDKNITYKKNELKEILPSYCISIHKSQGSEYPIVIIVIPQEINPIMDRSLIYTAITRSREIAIIIGNRGVIEECCKNKKTRYRKTILKEELIKLFID